MAQSRPQVQGLIARSAALELIGGVLLQHRMLSDLVKTAPFTNLSPSERATAQRMATATLRHAARADAMLKPFLKKTPAPVIQAILRIAVVELMVDDQAPHGVVNAAVALARQQQQGRSDALVNAVLRRVADADRSLWSKAPAPRLPNWLRGRLSSAFGNARVDLIEVAHERGAPIDLTPKNSADATELAKELGGALLETGTIRLNHPVQVSALPGFDEGAWWVQDAAAALPARLLAPKPGQRVLDLCAAPGGKTLQLAAAGAHVTALDMSGPRLGRLRENLQRTKLEAEIVVADALNWAPDTPFDAILLDAPCSATGTLRRHPDLPFVKDASMLKSLTALQEALIDRAVSMLGSGGTLVYCTCSLLPDEGEAQLARALERHPDLTVASHPDLPDAWQAKAGGLRLTPELWSDQGGLDGFFIAVLHKS
ncbi:MAG: 16S rRNA (cytosine967-C5)-methyltransferase [Paracoccaceae bacterium]|jgi:16S rRNA (cytosine967-C5)-methyltransferase